jgi:hypothetical protein
MPARGSLARLAWLPGLVFGLAACGESAAERQPPGRGGTRPGASRPAMEADAGGRPDAAIPAEPDAGPGRDRSAAAEDPRQERLRREWERYGDVVIEHSLAGLPEAERGFAARLLEAAELVEEIHLLQVHPSNLEWRDRVEGEGTEQERRLFHRAQAPWCLHDPDPECCALHPAPPREYGRGLWPPGLDAAEVEGLRHLINGRELLSPFTAVVRGEDGRLRAVPFAASPVFGPRLAALAAKLREAAEAAPHPSMKRFLRSRADAFESKGTFPYDDSDLEWLRLEGPWEVTIGPYETYDCPHGIKALFQMWVGRVDEGRTAEIRKLVGDLAGLRTALAALLGQATYEGRLPDPRLAPRAVEVWIAAGDARRERGAVLAYHLPNRGRAAAEGRSRSVVLANHVPLFARGTGELASRMLPAAQAALAEPEAVLANLAAHELAHGLGLAPDARIVDLRGRPVTLEDALRGHAAWLEELKAEALGLWLPGPAGGPGGPEGAIARSRLVAAVVHWLGLVQGSLSDPHGQMAAVQLGWHLEAGSLVWSAEDGRLSLDFEKMPEAVSALAAEALGAQLTGDAGRARALFERFLEPGPHGRPKPRGVLAGVRDAAIGHAAAMDPIPTPRYLVRLTPDP